MFKAPRNHHDLMARAMELRPRTKMRPAEAGARACLVLYGEHRARSSSLTRQVRLWRLVSQLRVQLWARLWLAFARRTRAPLTIPTPGKRKQMLRKNERPPIRRHHSSAAIGDARRLRLWC